jgi:hypothetical protein
MTGEFLKDDIRPLAAAYRSIDKVADGVLARAEVAYGPSVTFHVADRWRASDVGVAVRRTVKVEGSAPGGFHSAVLLSTDPQVTWPDVEYLAPGLLYGDASRNGDRTAGGRLNYAARRFAMREDWLPAPLFALSFRDGHSRSRCSTPRRAGTPRPPNRMPGQAP